MYTVYYFWFCLIFSIFMLGLTVFSWMDPRNPTFPTLKRCGITFGHVLVWSVLMNYSASALSSKGVLSNLFLEMIQTISGAISVGMFASIMILVQYILLKRERQAKEG